MKFEIPVSSTDQIYDIRAWLISNLGTLEKGIAWRGHGWLIRLRHQRHHRTYWVIEFDSTKIATEMATEFALRFL